MGVYVAKTLKDPEIVRLLLNGGVGVIPTDTVYGLVCRAADQLAVERLFTIKKREQKPGTIIGANIEQFADLGIKKRYLKAVEQYWPNAISVEIPHTVEYLHRGTGRQAFRIPSDEGLERFLEQTGALQTTSANQPDQPTASSYEGAFEYFGDTVDFYIDVGEIGDRPPSTIIRVVDDAIEVIREGAVKINENGRITA